MLHRLGTLLVLLSLASPAGAAAFTITIGPDGTPSYDGPPGMVVPAAAEPGEHYAWNVSLTENYTTARIVVEQAFDVERGKQIVPRLDDTFFKELTSRSVDDVDRPSYVVNVTGEDGNYSLALGLPGPGQRTLTLDRDVEPPSLRIEDVGNKTHFSFLAVTNTSEYALADLKTLGPGADDPVRHPTTVASLRQTFPVQGLEADTTYTWWVEAWDWAGNRARTDDQTITTLPKPVLPKPNVTALEPMPNTSVAPDEVVLRVTFESSHAVAAEDVRLFFDKQEVHQGVQLADGVLTYQPQGLLEPRRYTASVEITNEVGGTVTKWWAFEVEREASQAPGPAPVALVVALVGAALVAARRPRRR